MSNYIKDWNRAWTPEEISEHAEDWNLASDVALLNTLKSVSNTLLTKANKVNNSLENLTSKLDRTKLSLDIVQNKFHSLKNTQFIESRVYEEDETLPEKENQVKIKTEEAKVTEEQRLNDLTEAISTGLKVLDQYYEKVDVCVSDTEDDEADSTNYVLRLKDPYIDRPLPYIIGSEQWHKKWHVGLQDSSSESEKEQEVDTFSETESELDLPMPNSHFKNYSDGSSELDFSSKNTSMKQPVAVSTANSTKHGDIFESNASDFEENVSVQGQLPKDGSNFAEQLAAKLGDVIRKNQAQEPEVNKRPIQKAPQSHFGLFADEPPPLDDFSSGGPTGGMFSGGKGLFDDDTEEEDDLWAPKKPAVGHSALPDPVKSSSKVQEKIVSESFSGGKNIVSHNSQAFQKGLFDEEHESSDDDIFSSLKKKTSLPQKSPYLKTKTPPVPLFHEEPPAIEVVKEIKKPVGGVSLFGDTDIFADKKIGSILKNKRFISSSDDSAEENDRKNKREIRQENVEQKPQTNVLPTKKPEILKRSVNIEKKDEDKKKTVITKQSSNLFEDQRSKGPVNISIGEKDNKNRTEIVPQESSGLFDDQRTQPAPKKINLFDDDLFGDDLFSNIDKKFSSNLFGSDLFSGEQSANGDVKTQKKSLFDEDDIFQSVTKKPSDVKKYLVSDEKSSKVKDELKKKENFREDTEDIFESLGTHKSQKTFEKEDDDLFSNKELIKNSEDQYFKQILIEEDMQKGQSTIDISNESSINTDSKKELNAIEEKGEIDKKKIDLFSDDLFAKDDIFSGGSLFSKEITISTSSNAKSEDEVTAAGVKDFEKKMENKSETNILRKSQSSVSDNNSGNGEKKGKNLVEEETSKDDLGLSKKRSLDKLEKPKVGEKPSQKPKDGMNRRDQLNVRVQEKKKEIVYGIKKDDKSSVKDDDDETGNINVKLYIETSVESETKEKSAGTPTAKSLSDFSFLTSNVPPPPDDIWDNNSDNMDEPDEVQDDYRSQQSSLFDVEPPILFLNNPIGTREITNRLKSNSSLNPELSFTQKKLSSDIFSNEQVNDSIFLTKDKNEVSDRKSTNLEVVTPESTSSLQSTVEITASGNEGNLFSSVSMNTEMNMNNSENISPNNPQPEDGPPNKDNPKKEDKNIPGKLKHKLNINVGALLPGASLTKRSNTIASITPSQEDTADDDMASSILSKPAAISTLHKQYRKMEKSVSFDETDHTEVLVSVTKNRAKVPLKRRPSTRRGRQESLRNSVSDFKLFADALGDFIADDTLKEPSAQSRQDVSGDKKNTKSNDEIQANVEETPRNETKNQKGQNKVETVKKKESTEFSDDDLFKTLSKKVKKVEEAKVVNIAKPKQNLFSDSDDLFASVQSSKVVNIAKQNITSKKEDLFTSESKVHTTKGKQNIISYSDDLFSSEGTSKVGNIANPDLFYKSEDLFPSSVKSKVVNITKAKEDVFSDSDDLFSSVGKSKVENITKSNQKMSVNNEDLFASERKSTVDITKAKTKPEDLVSSGDNLFTTDVKSEKQNANVKISKKTPKDSKKGKGLFDSSDSDEDFLSMSNVSKRDKTVTKKGTKSKSLFDDEDEDDDLFGKSSANKEGINKSTVMNKKVPKGSNIKKLKNIEADEDPLSSLLG